MPVIIIMGVSGSGKSEIGSRLATALGCRFFDADAFHPAENVAKMSRLEPLTDADRWPWLQRMKDEVILPCPAAETRVLACSALKKSYRDFLRDGTTDQIQRFVYLNGDEPTILARMSGRNHFMKPEMLRSQLTTLEVPLPTEAMNVPVDQTPEEMVAEIVRRLQS